MCSIPTAMEVLSDEQLDHITGSPNDPQIKKTFL